jgi:hypothetical protein
VAVTDRHIFVMFDRVLGLIVPRYCFADETAENEFLREVRRRCPESAEWTVADRPVGDGSRSDEPPSARPTTPP